MSQLICILLVILAFMLGGQINKIIRPIAVPLIFMSLYLLNPTHQWWLVLPVLIYGGTLTIGYGDKSKLMKWLKSEQKVRIVSGLLETIPVILITLLTHKWSSLLGVPLIVGTYCLRLGSWGKIGKYNILPVDIFRGLAISLAISWALI